MTKSNKHIVSNPEILGGTPVIAGTRMPVSRIIHLLRDGYTMESIVEEYPQIDLPTLQHVVNQVIKKLENPKDATWIL